MRFEANFIFWLRIPKGCWDPIYPTLVIMFVDVVAVLVVDAVVDLMVAELMVAVGRVVVEYVEIVKVEVVFAVMDLMVVI